MNMTVLAAGFLFVTQSQAPKMGVTRASVDPARFDASIETAVYRNELPPRHLVHTWHVMDSKVFLLVPADRESTAETFRRKCGFLAWHGGADGVLFPDRLPPPRARALEEARKDVASCERLDELAGKCLGRPEPVRTEGRRARSHLHGMRVKDADLDYLRLENVVRAERLAKLLGEECGLRREVAAPFADVKPVPSFDPGQFPELKLELGPKVVSVPGDRYRLSFNAAPAFLMTFRGMSEKPLEKPPFPGGEWKLRLWIMTADGFLPYRYDLDLRREDEKPVRVRRPASPFYFLEPRFGTQFDDRGACPQVKDRPVRSRGPDYPDLRLSVAAHNGGEAEWIVKVTIATDAILDVLPAVTPGREDAWYVELTDPAGQASRAKLVWPAPADAAAAEANRKAFLGSVNFKRVEKAFQDRVLGSSDTPSRRTSVVEEWTQSSRLTGFGFTTDELASDRAFYEQRLKPLLDKVEKSGKTPPLPAFLREVEKARKEFLLK